MKQYLKIFTVYDENDPVKTDANIGIPVLVTVILIAFKLFGGLSLSWWLVTSPVWITLTIAAILNIVFTIVKGFKDHEKLNSN